MLKCLCSSSDRICHPAATEQHRHSLWPRASTDIVPLPLLGYCGKDYHTATSQCGDLGWSTQLIPFSLWTWGSEGPQSATLRSPWPVTLLQLKENVLIACQYEYYNSCFCKEHSGFFFFLFLLLSQQGLQQWSLWPHCNFWPWQGMSSPCLFISPS